MPASIGGLSIQARHLVKRGKQDNCAVGIRRLLALLSFGAELVWNQVSASTAETQHVVPLCMPGQPSALQTLPDAAAHSINNYVPMARARSDLLGSIPGYGCSKQKEPYEIISFCISFP